MFDRYLKSVMHLEIGIIAKGLDVCIFAGISPQNMRLIRLSDSAQNIV